MASLQALVPLQHPGAPGPGLHGLLSQSLSLLEQDISFALGRAEPPDTSLLRQVGQLPQEGIAAGGGPGTGSAGTSLVQPQPTRLCPSASLGMGDWEAVSLEGSRVRKAFPSKRDKFGTCADQKPGQSPAQLYSSLPWSAVAAAAAAAAARGSWAAPVGGGIRLCRSLCGAETGLSAARGVELSPEALFWACPAAGERRSPGLAVATGPELPPRGAETPAPLQSSPAVPWQRGRSEQPKPSRLPLGNSEFLQGEIHPSAATVPCFGWPCHTQGANGVNPVFTQHSPEQMTAASFSWEHSEAPRVVTGHCPRWPSVPSQWNESLQTGPVPLPKCPPLGRDSANPQSR